MMKTQEIITRVKDDFANKYKNFKDFQGNKDKEYHQFWNLCIKSLGDRDLLVGIIFANDLFEIPPVKTFLGYYQKEINAIVSKREKGVYLELYEKQAIGAFWAMVFRFVLDYPDDARKSISIASRDFFGVKTATAYSRMSEREGIRPINKIPIE
jgi:hypothetical protein